MIFISFPREGHKLGFSNQILERSRAQFLRRTFTNSLSFRSTRTTSFVGYGQSISSRCDRQEKWYYTARQLRYKGLLQAASNRMSASVSAYGLPFIATSDPWSMV